MTFSLILRPLSPLCLPAMPVRNRRQGAAHPHACRHTPPRRAETVHADRCAAPPQKRSRSAGRAEEHGLPAKKQRGCSSTQEIPAAPGPSALPDNTPGFRYTKVTDKHIRTWLEKPEPQRRAEDALARYATENQLNPYSLRQYVTARGKVLPPGQAVLDKAKGVVHANVNTGTQAAVQQPPAFSPRNTPAGSPPPVPERSAVSPRTVVKFESGHRDDIGHIIRPPVNNHLRVLQDPQDITRSLLAEAEKPADQITVTHWGGLRDELTPEKKKQITEDIREWLRTEGAHAQRFTDMLYVSIPLDDGPARGESVYAKRPIRRFEVIGPYAGRLHRSDLSLHQEMRKEGSYRVLSYLFETRSAQRNVSAYASGNTLSLVNTASLPGTAPGGAWKRNNVIAIRAGNNLTFYIACEDIAQDEELLVDYGGTYAPAGMPGPKGEPAEESDTQ